MYTFVASEMFAFQRPKAVYVHICNIRNVCISEAKGCLCAHL